MCRIEVDPFYSTHPPCLLHVTPTTSILHTHHTYFMSHFPRLFYTPSMLNVTPTTSILHTHHTYFMLYLPRLFYTPTMLTSCHTYHIYSMLTSRHTYHIYSTHPLCLLHVTPTTYSTHPPCLLHATPTTSILHTHHAYFMPYLPPIQLPRLLLVTSTTPHLPGPFTILGSLACSISPIFLAINVLPVPTYQNILY